MLKDDHPDKLKAAPEAASDLDAQETILKTSEDPLIGTLIAERIEILSLIGAGGMSTVYRAKHLLLDRIVAVKVMQVGKVDDNAIRRFQQEAKAATALNHPNIATVREFGTAESGDPYLVMDYIEGTSLSDLIKQNGTLSTERTKEIITQVCAGLHHAHSIGVVHRDLKPANVMLSKDSSGKEIAKIVDFGIAKIIQNDGQSELTKAGEIFGTPLYMSPEQGLGKTVDARSDIYSTGCMMYECLSGKPPFSAESALETLLQHTTEAPPPLKNSGDLAQVVYRCLEKKPEDRYASAEELSGALHDPTKIRPRTRDTKKMMLFGIASFVIGCLICFAVAVWQKYHPPHWQELAEGAYHEQNLGPGNYDAAKHLYLQAIAEAEKEHASDPDRENLYKKVGQFCNLTEDWDSSIGYLNKALELNSRHEENGETGSIHDWLSDAYRSQNRFEPAVKHGEVAVQLKQKYFGHHSYTLFALLHLGQAYRLSNKFEQAEQTDRHALLLAENLYPTGNDANVADAHEQLANVLADQHKIDEAIDQYKKALQSSIISRGAKAPKTKKIQQWLITYMRAHGKASQADKIPPL